MPDGSGLLADRTPCPFCMIVTGSSPAAIVYRDPVVVAFLDVEPATPGHVLVVSTSHIESLAGVDDDLGGRLFAVARKVAAGIRRSGLPCDGVNLLLSDGVTAGQEVPHLHLHVVPRTSGDGFEVRARWRAEAREHLEDMARRIATAFPDMP